MTTEASTDARLDELTARIEAKVAGALETALGDAVLTREELAKLLKVNPHQIPRLIKRRGLPAHRFGTTGRQWRFIRAEVLAWLASDRVK